MNCLPIAFLLLLALAAAPVGDELTRGTVSAIVEIDGSSVPLSGTLNVTLKIEGAKPLRVTPPKSWVVHEVAPFWRLRPVTPSKSEPLSGKRERFEQRFELSPYLVGPAVPFRLAEIAVLDGDSVEEKRLDWSRDLPIRVETSVTDATLQNLRTETGIETLPTAPPVEGIRSPWLLWLAVLVASIVLFVLMKQRRTEVTLAPHSKEWTVLELERLIESPLPSAAWCERFTDLLRGFVERHYDIPATHLTSDEWVGSLSGLTAEQSHLFGERLRLGDRIRFSSPESQVTFPFDRRDWISWSLHLVESLSPNGNLGETDEVG